MMISTAFVPLDFSFVKDGWLFYIIRSSELLRFAHFCLNVFTDVVMKMQLDVSLSAPSLNEMF